MEINFEKETYSVSYDATSKVIELREQIGKKLSFQRMELQDKLVKEALIAAGWTPPWDYNMKNAPKDGTKFLFKEEGSRVQVGRYGSQCGEKADVWVCLTNSGNDWYPSTKPIAWKPIVE